MSRWKNFGITCSVPIHMRSLLDTHAFLWFVAGDERLSVRARNRIEARESEVLLSIASIWEIAIKAALGRLPLPSPVRSFVPQQMTENKIGLLPSHWTMRWKRAVCRTTTATPSTGCWLCKPEWRRCRSSALILNWTGMASSASGNRGSIVEYAVVIAKSAAGEQRRRPTHPPG